MRSGGWCAVVFALGCTLYGWRADAVMMVDQSYLPRSTLGAALNDGYAFTGQSVTAGISGNLVAVELQAHSNGGSLSPWILDIQPMIAGKPGASVSSTQIEAADFPTDPAERVLLHVNLSTPVWFDAGQSFAMVLHPLGPAGGVWSGSIGYPGGTAWVGGSGDLLFPENHDLHFQTYVEAVPEPATYSILAGFMPWLLRRRRATAFSAGS